jgi:hypothetical protein
MNVLKFAPNAQKNAENTRMTIVRNVLKSVANVQPPAESKI